MTALKTKYKLAVLEGEEMLNFRNGPDMYTYCEDCVHAQVIPVATQPLGCTIGDDDAVKAFSEQVDDEEVDPEVTKCPGFESLAGGTPGVGEPRSASMQQIADKAEAGIMKDVPAELRPHSQQEWEQVMEEALEDLRKKDPETAGRLDFARDMVDKLDNKSQVDVEQEYDYFGEMEEHPSGVITYPRAANRQIIATLADAEIELFRFLKAAGLGETTNHDQKVSILAEAVRVWRGGYLANMDPSNYDTIIAEYELKQDAL